ncbi:hypothetical protein HN873_027901 [Arachis hypogaea]
MASEGHSLAELSDLNLGGELNIQGLKNVGSISEAKDANLKCKQDLQELCLSWGSSGKTKSVVGAEILEALQPHSNLKRLQIFGYGGLRLPTWMGNNSALISLTYLPLSRCQHCRHLPALGRLPCLRKLEIYSMNDVQYIEEDESYDNAEASPFPSLEYLLVETLRNVKRLMKRETTHMFPSLSTLIVCDCPKLQLPCLPRVRILSVRGCSDEQLKSISNLNGLNQLHLWVNDEVSCFPEGMMNNMISLATLHISEFNELKELPCLI